MNQDKDEKSREFSDTDEEVDDEEEELESKMEESDNMSLKELETEATAGKKFVGSLSEELANIGHIDSSETSDDSPEGGYSICCPSPSTTR